jgi:hypothetical protein
MSALSSAWPNVFYDSRATACSEHSRWLFLKPYRLLHYPIGSAAAGSLLGAAKRAKSTLFPAPADWRGGYQAGSMGRAPRANRNVAQGVLRIL